jgi:hypothetical protein
MKEARVFLQSERGSVLIASMILSCLIAIVSYSLFSYVQNMKTQAESVAVDVDFNVLVSQVNAFMQSEDSCRLAMGGPLTPGGTPQMPQTITPVLGNTQFVNIYYPQTTSGTLTTFINGAAPIALAAFPRLTNISTQLKITEISRLPILVANLIISASRPSGMQGAGTIANSKLNLSLHINAGNQIDSCTSLVFPSNPATPPIPPSAQGLPVCPTPPLGGYALYSDGVKIKCVLMVCPLGYLPVPTPNGFIASGPNAGDINCTPGF